MRLQSIQADGSFREFIQVPFHAGHEEVVLEKWLEQNPNSILEDSGLLVIGRQVATNLGTFIDLLGIDRNGDVVVVELKRDRTPRDTLAQALEYASFVESLDVQQLEYLLQKYVGEEISVSDYHRRYFGLEGDEAVAFNKDQRIVLVGQKITQEIRQSAVFLRHKGLRVTCLEFGFFEAEEGENLLSSAIVVGHEPAKGRPDTGTLPKITREEFLESLDPEGHAFFGKLFEFASAKSYPIHWGTNGFSMNVDLDGSHVAMCFGYRPSSVYGQSLYTTFYRPGGLLTKTAASKETAEGLARTLRELEPFVQAGKESKCVIDREYKEGELRAMLSWFEELEAAIREQAIAE